MVGSLNWMQQPWASGPGNGAGGPSGPIAPLANVVSAANVAVTVFGPNAFPNYADILNPSTASEPLYVDITAPAVAGQSTSLPLQPGQAYRVSKPVATPVTAVAATAGHTLRLSPTDVPHDLRVDAPQFGLPGPVLAVGNAAPRAGRRTLRRAAVSVQRGTQWRARVYPAQAAPSARYNLCRLVVEDSVGLLFGEGRFPALQSEDEATRAALATLMKEGAWNAHLSEVATRGSIGSVAVVMRILRGRVFLDVINSAFLTPAFDPEAPDELVKLTEARKVKGRDLEDAGYTVPREEYEAIFWYRREWGMEAETWYVPQPLAEARDGKPPVVDEARSVRPPPRLRAGVVADQPAGRQGAGRRVHVPLRDRSADRARISAQPGWARTEVHLRPTADDPRAGGAG